MMGVDHCASILGLFHSGRALDGDTPQICGMASLVVWGKQCRRFRNAGNTAYMSRSGTSRSDLSLAACKYDRRLANRIQKVLTLDSLARLQSRREQVVTDRHVTNSARNMPQMHRDLNFMWILWLAGVGLAQGFEL